MVGSISFFFVRIVILFFTWYFFICLFFYRGWSGVTATKTGVPISSGPSKLESIELLIAFARNQYESGRHISGERVARDHVLLSCANIDGTASVTLKTSPASCGTFLLRRAEPEVDRTRPCALQPRLSRSDPRSSTPPLVRPPVSS